MAESPAKWRKTSPSTSVSIDAPATPSRIPVLRKDGAKTTPGRPSFASPTKASLAKHHPQLLKRPSSSGAGGSRGEDLQAAFAKALSEGPPTKSVITGEERAGALSHDSSTQENEPSADERWKETEGAMQTQPVTTPSRSARKFGGGLSAKPRRVSRSTVKHPARLAAEAFDMQGIDVSEQDVNPFEKKGLRRSPVSSQPEPQVSDQIDPFRKTGLRRSPMASKHPAISEEIAFQREASAEVSTTPIGPISSHTGVAELSTERPLQQEVVIDTEEVSRPVPALELMSELLKQNEEIVAPKHVSPRPPPQVAEIVRSSRREEPELPPTPTQRGIPDPIVTTPPTGIHDTPSKRARRNKGLAGKLKSSPLKPRDLPPQEAAPVPAQEPEPVPEPKPQPVKAPKRRKSARFLIPEDPHAAKKKARDDLLKELQQLQADVALANVENERLHQRSETRKTGPGQPARSDDLVAMLHRATAPEISSVPKAKPVSIFKSIGSFLPFQGRRSKYAKAPISDKPIPSHLPIALDDPLPYLQAFSPLNYTSTITILPSDCTSSESPNQEGEPSIRQRHVIHASHLSGLFATRFSMTVDTSTLSITSVDILRLDMNAEKELGTFIRDRARRDGPLGRDVTTICWAMGRWIEVSIQRARFWCAVESEFGSAQARLKSLARSRKKKRKKDDQAAEDEAEDESAQVTWTRKQLLPQIGRTSMELVNEEVELRFEWRIKFDWTGEVDSCITAVARVPRNWEESDERRSLAKIPDMFNKLVKEKGTLGAVRTTVALLMQDS